MELVYHPRVPAEVAAILDYYERVAGPGLAAALTPSCTAPSPWSDGGPGPSPSGRADCDASTCAASLTTFSFASSTRTQRASWSCVTTGVTPLLAPAGANGAAST